MSDKYWNLQNQREDVTIQIRSLVQFRQTIHCRYQSFFFSYYE